MRSALIILAIIIISFIIVAILDNCNRKISLQDNIDDQENEYAYDEQTICHNWCLSSAHSNESWAITKCTWKNCSGCSSCNNNTNKSQTQQSNLNFFTDITLDLNVPSNHWDSDDLKHSFRSRNHHFTASFTDWDKDGFLDYFDPNHNSYGESYPLKFDFGLNRPYDNDATTAGRRVFRSIGKEVFIDTDAEKMKHDCHGSTFADMDGDGLLDLLISVGGGKGAGVGVEYDNLLFWGSRGDDDNSTAPSHTRQQLAGGREVARSAGVECPNCRGRFMLVIDANRDGKLEYFQFQMFEWIT